MGLVARAAFSWLLLLLQSRLVLLLQDDNASVQLLFRLTTAAERFRVQQALLKSSGNACCVTNCSCLRRAIGNPSRDDRLDPARSFPRLNRRGTCLWFKGGLGDASELCYGGFEERDLRSLSADSGRESALALDIGRAGRIHDSNDTLRWCSFRETQRTAPASELEVSNSTAGIQSYS